MLALRGREARSLSDPSHCPVPRTAVGDPIPGPTLIEETDAWRVFHKLDRTFGKPKVYAIFQVGRKERRMLPCSCAFCRMVDPLLTHSSHAHAADTPARLLTAARMLCVHDTCPPHAQVANPLFSSSPRAVALTRLLKTAAIGEPACV